MAFEAEAVLHARCLGTFAFRGSGAWVNGPAFRRGRELLQYLVSYPSGAVSREVLAATFWPDVDTAVAMHRLHLAVAGARAALKRAFPGSDGIYYRAGSYSWSAWLRVESDAETLRAASRSESFDAMRSAAALYNGEYLAGENAEWLYPLRIRYGNAYETILERLARNAIEREEYSESLEYALRLVEVDRAHEGATRLVMQSFGAIGRRGAALEAYEELAAYLRHHLSLTPSAETMRLREAIAMDSEAIDSR